MNEQQQQAERLENDLQNFERLASKAYYKLRRLRKHNIVQISDHAILRYMERVQGLDIEAVKQSILTPQLLNLTTVLGNGEFPIRDDSVRAIVENGVVVTILP